jgi:hypothetical protein
MRKTTLITDFDNTLYDWFHTWYVSFNAMLVEIERISGIRRAELITEIRRIRAGSGCLNRFSASISGASAGIRPPRGAAAG